MAGHSNGRMRNKSKTRAASKRKKVRERSDAPGAAARPGRPLRAETPRQSKLITREKNPANLESPLLFLESFITPNERFYIRNHFPVPSVNVHSWRLKIGGSVDHALEISYDELLNMASRTQIATLECAGNSRAYLSPKEDGVQWEAGAIGNAEWTGVPLAAVLDHAGVGANAVEILLEGLDAGEINKAPKSPGEIAFARSLPIAKARQGDVLLAYKMNGAPLPHAHGYPLRAVVPGWYGMASVKWLARIIALDRPFAGYFQTLEYTRWESRDGVPSLVPLDQMQIKTAIFRPARHERVAPDAVYRVRGAAWTGEAEIAKVEVSADGGYTWSPARFLAPPIRNAWSFWEYEWKTPARGTFRLLASATDSRGITQPPARDKNHRSYAINHYLPVEVTVRG